MESTWLSERPHEHLAASRPCPRRCKPAWVLGTLEVVGQCVYGLSVPSPWRLVDLQRFDQEPVRVCHWVSANEHAVCVACHTIRHRRKKTYLTRRLQDLPASGLTVYHAVKANRYICENAECSVHTFTEQFAEIADPEARLTHRLKDFIVQQGLDASANALARSLRSIGIRIRRETIVRLIKARGAVTVQQNLERKDVRVLSVDDIHWRKGQPSTACSVFIDAETHRPLVIVQGATQAVAEKVMRQYPEMEMVSRDRGSAYSAAANALGKPQVADGFHLVENLHQTVKESLQQILGSDAFVRIGAGWIRGVNEAADSVTRSPSADGGANPGEDLWVVRGPTTLTEPDREQRIQRAGLTRHQATKYRQTLAVLERTERGLRGPRDRQTAGVHPGPGPTVPQTGTGNPSYGGAEN